MGRVGYGNRANVFARCAAAHAALLGAAISLLACSGDKVLGDYPPSSCDLAEPPADFNETLRVASFWAADEEEKLALQTLLDRVAARGYVHLSEEMKSRVHVQTHINQAFKGEQLPDVFQVNGGSDVLRWVDRRAPEATDVCALDRLRDELHWESTYFDSALAPLTCQGSLYGLPVGIHHLNVLFYNRQLFSELSQLAAARGLELVKPSELGSVQELLAQLELIEGLKYTTETDNALVPLAVGTATEWPLTIMAFENVLLSLGREAYETLWLGGLQQDSGERRSRLREALGEMLSVLRRMRTFSDFDARVRWQDAVRQVGSGEAFMTITGDWGWAQLQDKSDVEMATFPGTAGTFVYTPDSFAVPRELEKHGFLARAFLRDVVADKEALIAFSNEKHSIPPLHRLEERDIAALDSESLRSTYEEFQRCQSGESCSLLLAVSGLGPPPRTDPCFDEMDALLTRAVWEEATPDLPNPRLCQEGDFPETSSEAETRLIEMLLRVAEQRFAADCR
jgi:glucose/mannose transport system substrate-binding protein